MTQPVTLESLSADVRNLTDAIVALGKRIDVVDGNARESRAATLHIGAAVRALVESIRPMLSRGEASEPLPGAVAPTAPAAPVIDPLAPVPWLVGLDYRAPETDDVGGRISRLELD